MVSSLQSAADCCGRQCFLHSIQAGTRSIVTAQESVTDRYVTSWAVTVVIQCGQVNQELTKCGLVSYEQVLTEYCITLVSSIISTIIIITSLQSVANPEIVSREEDKTEGAHP